MNNETNTFTNIEELLNSKEYQITTSNEDEDSKQNDIINFKKNYKLFIEIINKIPKLEERLNLIRNFYGNETTNPTVWNYILFSIFNTNKNYLFFNHLERVEKLLDYTIQLSNERFDKIKYKTSSIERQFAWRLEEDKNFGIDKPELVRAMGYNVYEVLGDISNEKIVIPNMAIINKLKNHEFKYFLEFLLIKYGYDFKNDPKLNILKDKYLLQYLENNFDLLLGIQYNDHPEFNNNPAWNVVIKEFKTKEAIGYFTEAGSSRLIGNVWVDERFRNKGIANSIFEYVENKLAKNNTFVVTTKNEHMKSIFKKRGYLYIGNTLPYISETYSSKTKANLENSFIEEIYLINKKDMTNQQIQTFINSRFGYENVLFPLYILDLTFKDIINQINKEDNFITITRKNIFSEKYLNYYTEEEDVYEELIYEKDGIQLAYPLIKEGGLYPIDLNLELLAKPKPIAHFLIEKIQNNEKINLIVAKRTPSKQMGYENIIRIGLIPKAKLELFKNIINSISFGIPKDGQIFCIELQKLCEEKGVNLDELRFTNITNEEIIFENRSNSDIVVKIPL